MSRSLGLDPDGALRESYSVLARKHLAANKKVAKTGVAPATAIA
jgi:hypothetical protein